MIAASPVSAGAYMAGRGPLTLPGGSTGLAFIRTKVSDDYSVTRPDIELVMGAGSLAGDQLGILRSLLGKVAYNMRASGLNSGMALNDDGEP